MGPVFASRYWVDGRGSGIYYLLYVLYSGLRNPSHPPLSSHDQCDRLSCPLSQSISRSSPARFTTVMARPVACSRITYVLPGQGAVSKRDRSGGGDSVSTVSPSKENSVCVGVMIPVSVSVPEGAKDVVSSSTVMMMTTEVAVTVRAVNKRVALANHARSYLLPRLCNSIYYPPNGGV